MKFIRDVTYSDDYATDAPDLMVVEIDPELAALIRRLAAEARRLDVYRIELFDYSAEWYEKDWDREGEEEDDLCTALGEECLSGLDCPTLSVSKDDFWWEVHLKGSSTSVISDSILISELPQ